MRSPASSTRARRRLVHFVPLILLGFSTSAWPGPIRAFDFTGIVTETSGNTGVFGLPGSVMVGDVFSGHFSYELGPGNPDQNPDPTLGVYDGIEFVIDQAVVPISLLGVGVTHEPGLPTIPPAPPDLGEDSFSIVGLTSFNVPVSLTLEGPFGTVFSDDSLPDSLALSDFAESRVHALVSVGLPPAPSIFDAGVLTSLTPSPLAMPEPSTALLLVAGVIFLGRARHRSNVSRTCCASRL